VEGRSCFPPVFARRSFGAKDHKAIAAAVGTRNATQVRTHAQKYFQKLARTKGKNGEREQEQAGNISVKDEDAVCTRHPHYTRQTSLDNLW
jgi:hypothetical protein